MVGENFRFGDFIERTLAAESAPGVLAELKSALSECGFTYLACASFGDLGQPLSVSDIKPVLIDYPEAWQLRYFEQNYVTIDPVVTRASQARIPYHWSEFRDLTPAQRRMFAEAQEFGLVSGLTVPIHGPAGEVFVASVAADHADLDPRSSLSVANMLINQTYSVLTGLKHPGAPVAPVALTGRERECLIWSARGKSSGDIGTILNISENTVNFHIKNVMGKLGAASRVLAVVKAIRLGLIAP